MNDYLELPDHWTLLQADHYVKVQRFTSDNQSVFMPPGSDELDRTTWDVLCHNLAWYAAERIATARDVEIKIVDSETGEELASDDLGPLQ